MRSNSPQLAAKKRKPIPQLIPRILLRGHSLRKILNFNSTPQNLKKMYEYNNYKWNITVVIPCYRVENEILEVLAKIPKIVDRIYCVDDCCPNGSGNKIKSECNDNRVSVIWHEENLGVGGSMVTGYRRAILDGSDVVVKIDGDGQMDPFLIPSIIRPILRGDADYTKGNRFYELQNLKGMPAWRLIGNAILSFFTKLSSGYWNIFDPTNGYTAIHCSLLKRLPLERVSRGYFFESDILFHLSTLKAVVFDVAMTSIYSDEVSSLRISRIIIPFSWGHLRNLGKRLFYNYFLRDFHIASVEIVVGTALFLFGVINGATNWIQLSSRGEIATAGTVMLSALPIILGFQMLLSALNFDIQNVPRHPVHPHFDTSKTKNL